MQRTELVTRLAELVTAHELPHPVRVAVDGPAEARPTVAAHVVIRNDDPNSPSIRKWPRGTGDGGAGADHRLRATPPSGR
ncbi:hypothetical protein BJF90_28895 [Pseudonocardia sp. CNS-004]|nr:hypothetical protein BJF90_28895 [Pseudonocardia sp. CNS-004]